MSSHHGSDRAFRRVLVANRGEIAVRIIRGVQKVGLRGIAVYAEPDRDSPHLLLADEAVPLGGVTAAESYLDVDKLLSAAHTAGADAIHPGYGFLSENADFAEAVIAAGLVWIGPDPDTIRILGDKVTARRIAQEVGAPLVPGTDAPVDTVEDIRDFVRAHGLPIVIKAAFGGGGRGLKVVRAIEEIPQLFDSATREAITAFGRGECLLERYLDRCRHVEAQVVADRQGHVVVAGTRDCSLQRRHQKLVEEAPAPFLTESQLSSIVSSAKQIFRKADYVGVGTVEYLVADDGTVTFLEVNTRLQVEHPVTEETTGWDLVAEQLRVASGRPLSRGADPEPTGHSFEFRINSEDPGNGFLPRTGTVSGLRWPTGEGIRVDAGIRDGSMVNGEFDSLLAKLIVTGPDRDTALIRSRKALDDIELGGLPTVIPFHRAVIHDPAFTSEERIDVHTRWIETEFDNQIPMWAEDQSDATSVAVRIGRRVHRVRLPGLHALGSRAKQIRLAARDMTCVSASDQDDEGSDRTVTTTMQGTLVHLAVSEGDLVMKGDLVAVVEAMKMENPIYAPVAGRVSGVNVAVGDTPAQGAVLCVVEVSPRG
ncbi:MAG: biotin carboxylase N-terminal domain-containing protein [Nocardioides sp.]|uniref:acetyl/propionyl/methylcrotonyl-CoA carboxylase subunit alpha n=1 Tax=Nocardioides sp. TaxID=35761 RepID=UPI0039E559F7